MMNSFESGLRTRLDRLQAQNLYRTVRRVDSPQGPRIRLGSGEFLNFASNDYLGLANDPRVTEAAARTVRQHGAGSGGSRLLCGSLAPWHQLEETLADFKGMEAALTFSSGYAAALGTVCALVHKQDVVILDKLSHACLVDAARLSGARLRVFRHNDLDHLESLLRWASGHCMSSTCTERKPSVLILTESVFSMDGDLAPLKQLVALKERYGAWLMLDEAHATGLYGPHRRGLAEAHEVSGRVEVQMGTLGKALGASGGYICGSRNLIDLLINCARTFIFSTAPAPAAAAAAAAAVEIVRGPAGEQLRGRLWSRAGEIERALKRETGNQDRAIFPVIVGAESQALQASAALQARGIHIPAVRFPAVPRGKARLRLTVSAAHTQEDTARVSSALAELNLVPALTAADLRSHAPPG